MSNMNIEEIVVELDEMIHALENDEYSDSVGELLVELKDLAERIRPQEKKFVQVPCSSLDLHNEHLWTRGEYSYYCPGRDFD